MSKGKKANPHRAQADISSWDEGLVGEIVEDDLWQPYLVFLVSESCSGEAHVQALADVVNSGIRKKFVSISKKDLLKTAQEDSKLLGSTGRGGSGKRSKQGHYTPVQKPLYPQVCEHVVTALTSGEPLPLSMLARMLKYMVLKRRSKDVSEKEATLVEISEGKKVSLEKKKDKSGKKAKESPVMASSSVTIPTKVPTQMKKRGEEEEQLRHINDEPDYGPSFYVILTGFYSPELLKHLGSIKLRVNALFKVLDRENKEDKTKKVEADESEEALEHDMSMFWAELDKTVKDSPSGSMLRDMAKLELKLKASRVPQEEIFKVMYGQNMFNDLAGAIYKVLDQYIQYQHYLDRLHIQHVPFQDDPPPPICTDSDATSHPKKKAMVDMRCYADLLSGVPQECITVPLVIHAMVEQVSTFLTKPIPSDNECQDSQINPEILSQFMNIMNDLALSKKDRKTLGIQKEKSDHAELKQAIITHGDQIASRNLNIQNTSFTDRKKIEEDTIKLAGLNSVLGLVDTNSPSQKAEINALNHYLGSENTLSSTHLNHALILLSLENVELQSASTSPMENFHQPCISTLLFDHPFNLNIVSKVKSFISVKSLVSVDASDSSKSTEKEQVPTLSSSYTLNVNKLSCNLEEFSTLEAYEFSGLLQELLSISPTHPYMEIFEHKLSESIVLVLHSGFDGRPVHTYQSSSHMHTKVGFQNYLQHIMKRYGHLVDEAVEEDVRKATELEITMEDKRKFFIPQKLKEASEEQYTPSPTGTSISTADRNKKGRASSLSQRTHDSKAVFAKKKSKILPDDVTSQSSMPDLQDTGVQLEIPKLFTGYDLGDEVLVKERVYTTVFTADGVRIQSKRLLPFHGDDDEASFPCEISLQHNGHQLTTSQVWSAKEQEETIMKDSLPNDVLPSSASIPQLPLHLQYATLSACFHNSIRLSYSYYGPKANGDLPYLPFRPHILDLPAASEVPCPPHQRSTSPKLSKKLLEHQQQLLEQQRLQKEKLEKERQEAQEKYECSYNRLMRNNKYQQLFISTECGLNVHCQAIVNLEADPCLMDGSDAFTVVKQWYSYPDTATHLGEYTARERCRYYYPEGYVVKYMVDETVVILAADGSKYRPATSEEVEIFQEKCSTSQVQVEVGALDVSFDQTPRKATSPVKVTFADELKDDSPKIWFVTSPMGKSYLWQKSMKEKMEDDTTTEEVSTVSGSIFLEDEYKDLVVEFDSLHLLKATDPITKEVHITREDNVVFVQRPNSHVTQFQEGTRFTVSTTYENGHSQVTDIVIESNGFARVCYTASTQQCRLEFPDNSSITCFNNGAYKVKKPGDYKLHIESTGEAQYKIPNATYTLDHTKRTNVFYCRDSKDNVFSMNYIGQVSAESVNSVQHKSYVPRYFVLNADRTAYELHKNFKVEDFESSAKLCPCKVVVVKGTVPSQPDIRATTVIEALHNPRAIPVVVPLKEESIAPQNLRCGEIKVPPRTDPNKPKPKFGSLVGKGLTIGSRESSLPPPGCVGIPLALKYRQFLHLQPLTSSRREEIYTFLASFIHQSSEHMKASDALQPVEKRDDSEIEFSNSLQLRFNLPNNISDLYENRLEQNIERPATPPPPSRSREGMAFIEKSKSELEEAEDIRAAICNKVIPPFFKSEECKRYGFVEPQDIDYLSTKLVQVPDIVTNSQTTIQSASSLSLNLDDSEFAIHATPSLANKEPPALYSPDLVERQGMPSQETEARPTNPTPYKTAMAANSLGDYNQSPSMVVSVIPKDAILEEQPGSNVELLSQQVPSGTLIVATAADREQRKEPNIQYCTVEEPVRRKVTTSSTVASTSNLRGLEVTPLKVNFGVVCEGCTYTHKLTLKNIGIELAHFKIKQPPLSTGLRVIYSPGAVAAGLTRQVTVELFAVAVGTTEHGTNLITHELEIVTELYIIYHPITANVLTRSMYDSQRPSGKLEKGVKLVSTDNNTRSGTKAFK